MEFLKICGTAAICCAAIMVFGGREKELASLISSLIYIIVMFCFLTRAGELISSLKVFAGTENVSMHFPLLLKIGGIALIGAVASTICENTGQRSASSAIDLLSVLEILYISIPIVKELLEKVSYIFGK